MDESEAYQALAELQQYLSDQVAPLMVADSVSLLLQLSPEVTASGIQTWAASQIHRDRSLPVADFLYHAMTKIHLLGEYKLIPFEILMPFLAKLKVHILEICPESEREQLSSGLERIGEAPSELSPQVQVLHRSTAGESAKSAQNSPSIAEEDIHRFHHLLKRLEKKLGRDGLPAENQPGDEDLISSALAEAARSASETMELNRFIGELRGIGVHVKDGDLFRALGRRLPAWSQMEGSVQIPMNSNLQALHRMIAKAPDAQQSSERFHHLVKTAIERFNDGFLAQSASMFDLAGKIVESHEVDAKAVEVVRTLGHENLGEEKLKKYADASEVHSIFRKVLNFFPALTPEGLLESLEQETRRERRRLILLLLEAHGVTTRTAVLKQLENPASVSRAMEEVFYFRNLIYLLRHILPAEDESMERTAEVLLRFTYLSTPPLILKEILAYLSVIKNAKVEQHLKQLLSQMESALLHSKESLYEAKEVSPLLDRAVTALCRQSTHTARQSVMDHALKKNHELGDSMARLSEFSNQDLSDDPETVERLLKMLKGNLPLKLLGISLHQRDHNVKCLVEALSGTSLPQVRSMLEELTRQYPEYESGRAAVKALDKRETLHEKKTVGVSNVSLVGDLDLFGLPNLIQHLSDSSLTGILTMKNPGGEVFATLALENGMFKACQNGLLSGESAFYQLFERSQSGTFEFGKKSVSGPAPEGSPILPMMMEAIRRYDELQELSIQIADDVRLKARSDKPVPFSDEHDGILFRDLWNVVRRGASPLECETSIGADAYRIRRLLIHWLQSGVIESS